MLEHQDQDYDQEFPIHVSPPNFIFAPRIFTMGTSGALLPLARRFHQTLDSHRPADAAIMRRSLSDAQVGGLD